MRPHVPLSYQFHLQLKRQREWESQVHLVLRLVEPPTDESWISWWESLHVQAGKLIGHANDWGWKMGRWFYGIAFGSERPSTTFSCRPKNQRNVYIYVNSWQLMTATPRLVHVNFCVVFNSTFETQNDNLHDSQFLTGSFWQFQSISITEVTCKAGSTRQKKVA